MSFVLLIGLLISCILLSVFSDNTKYINGIKIDLKMQRVLLDKHNELRNSLALNGISKSSQPKSTFMNKLHWDPILAANAQKFTDKCSIGHNNNRVNDFKELDSPKLSTFNYDSDAYNFYLGENYLWYPRTDDTIYEDAINFAEKYWWDEHLEYSYSSNYCKGVCGHYTQMAWADTRYVGCGASICPSSGYNYLFLICEYYPSGNFNGNKPYPSGTPCSDCLTLASDRDTCDGNNIKSGLCSGCQSPNWNLCDDRWTNCGELKCPNKNCKRTCNGCPTKMLSPSPTCIDEFDGLSQP